MGLASKQEFAFRVMLHSISEQAVRRMLQLEKFDRPIEAVSGPAVFVTAPTIAVRYV